MPNIFFSIIVPVFNRQHLLYRCVDSLLRLHLSHYEVILVDDGSEDSAGEVCDQYAKEDSRIRVIHQANQGVVTARAAGWKASLGKYVAFVDSDDWLDPDAYTWILQQMEAHPNIDIGIPRLILELGNGKSKDMFSMHERRILDRCECIREIFLEQKSFCWEVGKIYRRSLLVHWQPDVLAYPFEDLDMFWQMLRIAKSILYDGKSLYHYLVHVENSRWVDVSKCDSVRSLLHVWTDIKEDIDVDLKQNLCIRLLLEYQRRIRSYYFHGISHRDLLQKEIVKMQEIYHEVPDKSKIPDLARLVANEGASAVDQCYWRFLDGIKQAVRETQAYSNLYVYGTGAVSMWLRKVLEQERRMVFVYVVSDGEPKAREFQGHEVRYLSEIPVDRVNNVFLLAMTERHHKEVSENLRACGHKNIISFSTHPVFDNQKLLMTRY